MLYLVLALIALLPACLGQQQDCVPADFMAHVMFVESDVDGDGVLHLRELIDVFREYDDVDNPDGIVTREEYVKYQTRHDPELDGLSHELYNVYDVNNDHRLTMDDYDGFYRQMDVDTDDSVTQPEFTTYWTKLFNSVKHHTNLIC